MRWLVLAGGAAILGIVAVIVGMFVAPQLVQLLAVWWVRVAVVAALQSFSYGLGFWMGRRARRRPLGACQAARGELLGWTDQRPIVRPPEGF